MKRTILITVFGIGIGVLALGGSNWFSQYTDFLNKKSPVQVDDQQKKDIAVKTVYTCPMHPEVVQDKPGKCPKCGMTLVAKEVKLDVYTCPMHPEVITNKPGKCPKCGMNLVKKEPAKKPASGGK